MIYTIKGDKVEAKLWLPKEEIEPDALKQLTAAASLPWAVHVAVMPDAHHGKGATVGSVIALKDAVSPASVGVDIGCGMGAILTSLTASRLPLNLKPLRADIEAAIPVGFNAHESPVAETRLKEDTETLFGQFHELDPSVKNLEQKALKQLGTLGGGNHFIELCIDTEQRVWMMLHSGSRNIGKVLASVHIERAKQLAHNAELPDPDLAVFLAGTPEMEAYRRDLFWAQQYAFLNRRTMFSLYKKAMGKHFPEIRFGKPILCHHNYVDDEVHFGEQVVVTRKGAISAKPGELGIIPGSMGTKSYIVQGLGNPDSLMSASHGAGRKMSRGAAKRTFTLEDFAAQTKNVECRRDEGVLDEIPGAYKDIGVVMERQKDLVKVVAELKQVLCVKG